VIAALTTPSCIGFQVECGTMLKGGLAVLMGFVLFIGSPMLLLSAVFGRRMAYLVVAVSWFAWIMILSSIWTFGFYSQGPSTPVNLGPRGAEPAWVVEAAGTSPTAPSNVFNSYPTGSAWREPGTNDNDQASIQAATSAAQAFLVDNANEKAGKEKDAPGSFQTTDFTVENVRFATQGNVSYAAAEGYYNGGGPLVKLYLRHDSGSVNRYSWMFLIGSTFGFAIHLPFLDRAERKRKAILTGGTAPPWYGPA
jgi:hypothetical protein